MPCYDRISGSLKQVKTIYDRISGSLKEVKTGYDRISGSLKVYHQSGIRLGDLPLGSKVGYNDIYYTLIAHDGFVDGDSVLWTIYGSGTVLNDPGTNNAAIQTTPFGTDNSNLIEMTVSYVSNTSTGKVTGYNVSGYGVILTGTILGDTLSSLSVETPAKFAYFDSASKRIRYNASGNASYYWTSSNVSMYDEYDERVEANRMVSKSGSFSSSDYQNYCLRDIYAYSVHADLLCTENSDGTYTLNI